MAIRTGRHVSLNATGNAVLPVSSEVCYSVLEWVCGICISSNTLLISVQCPPLHSVITSKKNFTFSSGPCYAIAGRAVHRAVR